MSLIVQPSLFGSTGRLGITELGAAVERTPLADGAWVDLRPGFVTAADELLDEARAALNGHYAEELGEPFVTAGLCLYRDGGDSVAWHGDRIARESPRDTMVAIVSLGATRPFALRPKSGGRGLRLQVGHGDLLVMGGSCQRTWLHAIPKTAHALGARISIQFRPHWGSALAAGSS